MSLGQDFAPLLGDVFVFLSQRPEATLSSWRASSSVCPQALQMPAILCIWKMNVLLSLSCCIPVSTVPWFSPRKVCRPSSSFAWPQQLLFLQAAFPGPACPSQQGEPPVPLPPLRKAR